jgi:pimeloyl-ACP methyl ester carboxylesterase
MPGFDFPDEFHTVDIVTNGTTIHVRHGGSGSPVVLLHGYGETGDMWASLAADLARDHAVVVPDLRGLGLSAKPSSGFDKKTQAEDVAGVLDALRSDSADLVTHDIGNMVGFAFAAQHPQRVISFMPIDAPIPGVGPWEQIVQNPLLWHLRFGGPDMERLVAGRARIYLDRFWNEFSDNKGFLTKGKLSMRVLAVGGEKSFGTSMADIMRFAASDVRAGVIPNSGHWIMEENPTATIAMVRDFLRKHEEEGHH